ncbi:MAG TPA: hypothetical protein VGM02_01085 [Acidobacteriaceae bacterium]|jgi:hypothetical protein
MRRDIVLALALVLPAVVNFGPTVHALPAESLAGVRKIYIEKMDNHLDQYLAAAISKQFHGTVSVVLDRSDADAVMRGLNTMAQNTTESNVQLVDRSGQTLLWSGSAGDRNMMALDLKHGGQAQIANKLVKQLKKAMQP